MAARTNNSTRSKARKNKAKAKRKPARNPVHTAIGFAAFGVVAAALVNGAIDVGRAISA